MLVGVDCGNFDGDGVLDGDFVVVGDVLCLLEVVVSFGLAILGETEKAVGLDDLIA